MGGWLDGGCDEGGWDGVGGVFGGRGLVGEEEEGREGEVVG